MAPVGSARHAEDHDQDPPRPATVRNESPGRRRRRHGNRASPLPAARFAYGAHTWKEIAHLLANLPMALLGFVYVVVMVVLGIGLSVTVVGLPLLAVGLIGARQFGKVERARARALLGLRIEEPTPIPVSARKHGGFFPWLWASLKDPVAWRNVLYEFIRLPWGC